MVELNKHQETFDKLGVEIIVVLREESAGVEGLQKMKDKTKSTATLVLDTGKKKTPQYSPRKGKFDNYVVGPDGKIVEIIKGNLVNRAKSEQLIKAIKSIKQTTDD